jgi:GT2 family glycosyltransferase
MKVILAIPVLNQYDHLFTKLLPSVWQSTVKPDHIFIWDNGGELRTHLDKHKERLEKLVQQHFIPFTAVENDENVGLSRAWNAAMQFGKQLAGSEEYYVIQSNDDVIYLPDTFEKLIAAANDNPTQGFLYPAGARAGNSFSLFLIKRWLYEKVGPFDEGIVRAYFEDNLYHWNMKRVGEDIHGVLNAEYIHVGSASSKNLSPEEQYVREHVFRRNEAYYKAQTGGLPGQETYTEPWNGDPDGERKFNATYVWS